MRKILGVDLDADVEPMFAQATPGRILVLDGDFAAYKAAATAKTLPVVYRRFIQDVLTDLFLTQSEYAIVHVTASASRKAHRALYPTFWPYQDNRKDKKKPPLLEPLRHFLSEDPPGLPENVEVILHHHWEADDGIIMDGEHHLHNCIVKSGDKDLRMTRAPYWEEKTGRIDVITDRFGWIDEAFTDGGARKVIGHGTAFFWAQMLMGDTADRVRGLDKLDGKQVGAAGALEFLAPFRDESECANAVLWEYAKSKQNALAEAEMMWLRRNPEDSAFAYLMELELDDSLRHWLQATHEWHLKVLAQKLEETDDE